MENKLPEGWEWKKLGEIAVVEKKVIRPEDIKGTYQKYIGLENIEKDTGRLTDFSETLGNEIKSNKYRFTAENILYGKLRPYLNKVFLPDFEGICSTDILTIKTVKGKAIREYVALLMRQPFFVSYANTRSSGANLPRINESKLLECKIPVPPIETQQKIVSILEKAEETKKLRAQAGELTQKLLQSVFLEMFGNPVKNSKQFDIVQLKSVFSEKKEGTKCGPFGSALKKHEYVEDGISVWTMDNIAENKFTKNGCLFITEEKYNELKAYSVDEGDILISRAGTVGKMCVVNSIDCPSIISTNLIRLSLNPSKIEPIYFTSLMTYFKGRIGRLKTGEDGAYTFMNTGILKDLRIPLPPFKLQRFFAKIVEQVEKTNYSQNQSSLEINNLFDALMQKAFIGELVS